MTPPKGRTGFLRRFAGGRWVPFVVLVVPLVVALRWYSTTRLAGSAAVVLTRGPYLQLLTTHSVTLVWQTDRVAACSLKIRSAGSTATLATGDTSTRCAIAVEGLKPGTLYGYVPQANRHRLRSESVFRTDDPTRPFTFLVLGDSGTGDSHQIAVRDRMLATPADFILHTGDMVYPSGRAADFDPKFFTPYGELLRRLTFWPCLGNHDVRAARGAPWRAAFLTPANNLAADDTYYSFDFGNAHVVVLNSHARTTPGSPQYEFLDQDLGASAATWKFVAFHHTIYSNGKHGSNAKIRAHLVPLFDKHGVNLVFMGHDHDYERTRPLRGDHVVAPEEGTVYITTGGGGGPLFPVASSSFTAYAESAFHFVRVAVDGPRLQVDMIRDDGAIRDSTTLAAPTRPRVAGSPPRSRVPHSIPPG
jgi:3',5'-cyclic AMP phosphodiesterase CpdA